MNQSIFKVVFENQCAAHFVADEGYSETEVMAMAVAMRLGVVQNVFRIGPVVCSLGDDQFAFTSDLKAVAKVCRDK